MSTNAAAFQRRAGVRFAITAGIVAATALVACTDDGAEDGAGDTQPQVTLADEGPVAVTELATGDCFDGVVIGLSERISIDSVDVVDCAGEHDLEVFTAFNVRPAMFSDDEEPEPLDSFPGRARIIRVAETECRARLVDLELDSATIGTLSIWPTPTSWGRGDRSIACAIFRSDGRPFDGRQVVVTGN